MDENMSRGYVQLGRGLRPHPFRASNRAGGTLLANPPRDPCNCIYMGLLLAGVGFLLPYNSFIIAVDYYQHRYPGTTVVFDMSLVYIIIAFGAVIINNLLVESLSLHIRITFGYVLSFFTLLFVALCIVWFDVFDLQTSYSVNLMAVAVVALGCTVQQSSFYGYTSMLPPRYTQAVMTGESAAGLLISSNRILTKSLLDNERINTIIFFGISIFTVILCIAVHFAVRRTDFVAYYMNLYQCINNEADDLGRITLEPTEDLGLVDILDAVESRNNYGVLKLQSPTTAEATESSIQSRDTADANMENANYEYLLCSSKETIDPKHGIPGPTYKVQDVVIRMRGTYSSAYTGGIRVWTGVRRGILARYHVAKTIWPYMLSIGLNYFVTLCLFPGIESEIISCSFGNWMPVLLMAIFNLFDFIGKIISSVSYEFSRTQLVMFSLARIALVPMMTMCAAPRVHPLIPGEGWAMFFSLLLGITNGVFGSVPMIVAATKVPDEHRELTGNIMTLSYSLGLTTGSGVAYLLDELLGAPFAVGIPCTPSILMPISFTGNSSRLIFENVTSALYK